jgi:excisionase family DNA binding protein
MEANVSQRDRAERPLISVPSAAGLLGVGTSVVYRWLRAGKLPGAVQLEGRWYVRRAVLASWVNGTEVPAAPPR